MQRDSGAHGTPTWRTVKEMYEAYPYPSPIAGDSVIDDVANCLYSIYGRQSLESCRILDAGCGTGHRLIGVAKRYPGAQLLGIDMTEASLDVAERLAERHHTKNVQFERHNLLDLELPQKFDVVVSSGVIHHLEDPIRGLRNLAALLAPEGILIVWLYNSVGERERLLARELLQLMWDQGSGIEPAVEVMRELGLKLELKRYGRSAAQKSQEEASQLNIDVDAFVHPIVNAYTFDETFAMLRACTELGWGAINNINLVDTSKLLDLQEAESTAMRHFCQSVDDLFDKSVLRERFRKLSLTQKLRAIEITLKPTGFTAICGCGSSYLRFGPRVVGNVVNFARVARTPAD